MKRRHLHFALAGALVAIPFVVWGTQAVRDRLTLAELRRLDPPLAVLAEPVEDPARPPGAWLLIALRDRPRFDRAAAFCRDHGDLPLPNCTNLLVADRLLPLLPAPVAREAADAR